MGQTITKVATSIDTAIESTFTGITHGVDELFKGHVGDAIGSVVGGVAGGVGDLVHGAGDIVGGIIPGLGGPEEHHDAAAGGLLISHAMSGGGALGVGSYPPIGLGDVLGNISEGRSGFGEVQQAVQHVGHALGRGGGIESLHGPRELEEAVRDFDHTALHESLHDHVGQLRDAFLGMGGDMSLAGQLIPGVLRLLDQLGHHGVRNEFQEKLDKIHSRDREVNDVENDNESEKLKSIQEKIQSGRDRINEARDEENKYKERIEDKRSRGHPDNNRDEENENQEKQQDYENNGGYQMEQNYENEQEYEHEKSWDGRCGLEY
ncbi:hypothetical protein HDU97_005439 [Phlyctochytrium planicorne]|nr:hypothetical protein HDU97_005439 [Phlyctochytrium planicorne]